MLDNLKLYHNGNQLQYVQDYFAGAQNQYGVKEYQNKSNTTDEFAYDKNGNMVKDLDRDIVTIRYNLLNLPDTVQFRNGNQINQIINRYAANGAKFSTTYLTGTLAAVLPIGAICTQSNLSGAYQRTKIYAGSIEYENEGSNSNLTIARINTPEGYISWGYGLMFYNFYLKDHLGNVRETYSARQESFYPFTGQRMQYYATGLPRSDSEDSGFQPYKYNGKEWIEAHGLDEYDYGARGMYPAIGGGFMSVDPLAEMNYSVSPYVYCNNNPVNMIDPTGMLGMASTYVNKKGEIIDHFDDGDNKVYLVSDQTNWILNGRKKDGLPIIGFEDPKVTYKKGEQYVYYPVLNSSGTIKPVTNPLDLLEIWIDKDPESLGEFLSQITADITYNLSSINNY